MSRPDPARVRAWSEEVARDPASLSFLPLAAAYLAEGRPEAALRLCLRGLERHPAHVEAHHLLGLLYLERGEETKAFDEWDIALRLDGDHHPSRREIARLSARSGDLEGARRHLERLRAAGEADAATEALVGEGEGAAAGPAAAPRAAFASAALAPEVAGAVLMDTHGLVVMEAFAEGGSEGRGAEMAAHLAGASDEAGRVARHLELGGWRSIVVETGENVVHVSSVGEAMLALAVRRGVPMGWAVRHAARVRAAVQELSGEEPA